MKKLCTLLFVCVGLISFESSAQITVGLGGGFLKSTDEGAEGLLGGELYGKYSVSDALRVGVNLGYYQDSEEILGTKLTSSLTPVSILGEYLFLDEGFRPYIGVHVGLLYASAKLGSSKSSDSYFSVAPVAGAEFGLTEALKINFNFKYGFAFYDNELTEGSDNYSTISPNIGVAYTF